MQPVHVLVSQFSFARPRDLNSKVQVVLGSIQQSEIPLVRSKPAGNRDYGLTRFALAAGFTLIELLVVIAITAVLMALLFPVVGRMRLEGQAAVCAGNLRQIASGAQLYAAENSGRLPGNPDRVDGSVVGWNTSPSWPLEILPYAGGDPRIFVSPGLPKYRDRRWPQYEDQLTPALPGSSYMLNGQVSHRPLSTLPEPSKIVMLWTWLNTSISASRYPNTTSGGDWDAVSPLNWETIPYNGRMNWLFVDGHVERGKPSDYYLPEKFSQGRFWDWRDARRAY